jgi:aryl-alcohol dehydrogenase-like predicted oxidoreductase
MRPLALGCMRLSTEPARDDAASLAVLAAALDAVVTLLDTADAYCLDDTETGHNERLIQRAIAGRDVRVITKGGLVRPGGAWAANGRAKHLAAAARASRERLGAIDVYLLHAIDPKTPLATSVRALARIRDDGIARAIGLSNVSLTQLEEAEAITRIDAVEIELSPWKLDAVRGGLVAACEARGIELYAHRPLGGPAGVKRLAKDPTLAAIAKRFDATAHEVALAWLRSLSPAIIPLPGATRIETARSTARTIDLDDAARAELAARFLTIGGSGSAAARSGEVVLVTGMPGAGKSTLAADYAERGYLRLNRDERGGSLLDLARALDDALAGGADRVVLDNTYPSRASRAPVIELAHRHGLAARCVVLATPLERAQANAAARTIAQHGRLLEPAELARAGNVGPGAQFRYRREAEPPRADEGFDAIDEVAFTPRPRTGGRAALLVELDAMVWHGRPTSPDRVQLRDGAREALTAWSRTHAIAGTSWMPGVSADAFAGLVSKLGELVGVPIVAAHCAHPAGPPVCWCRKPLPGLALWLAHAHGLDLARSLCVGGGPADKGFALRADVAYHDIVWGWPTPPVA